MMISFLVLSWSWRVLEFHYVPPCPLHFAGASRHVLTHKTSACGTHTLHHFLVGLRPFPSSSPWYGCVTLTRSCSLVTSTSVTDFVQQGTLHATPYSSMQPRTAFIQPQGSLQPLTIWTSHERTSHNLDLARTDLARTDPVPAGPYAIWIVYRGWLLWCWLWPDIDSVYWKHQEHTTDLTPTSDIGLVRW